MNLGKVRKPFEGPKPVYIIAEMACSHEGDPQVARRIIDGASQGGADAIQFQIWSLKEMVVPHHPDYEKLMKLEMSWDDWRALFDYAKEHYPKMHVIACVYEQSSVDFCESLEVDAYKLHSSDLSNPYLMKYVASTGRRVDLSIGASTFDEIRMGIDRIRDIGQCEVWLMYGYQDFPTKISDVHLRYMMKLKELFELPVGYQDHTDPETSASFWVPAAAIGMGVDAVEKHITHDRALKGADHEAAMNPDEFREFVEMVRAVEEAMGVAVPKPFSEEELRYRIYSKKSLVTSRDLETGETVSDEDLTFMRAETLGLPPDQSPRLIGKKMNRAIRKYHLIREEDVS